MFALGLGNSGRASVRLTLGAGLGVKVPESAALEFCTFESAFSLGLDISGVASIHLV